jgi:two-component system NtrC family sensor kinase
MNIVANAIDAIEEAGANQGYQDWANHPGQITIRTRPMAGDWVGISIADNGKGMSEQTLKRLFDPFFTSKPVGKGTGIGMAISYQIITEGHNGTLDVSSQPGQGSEVTIEHPGSGDSGNLILPVQVCQFNFANRRLVLPLPQSQ